MTPPAKEEAQTITKGDKTYHWCSNHKAWVVHDPAECKFDASGRIKTAFKSKQKNPNNGGGSKKSKSSSSQQQQVLQAIFNESSDDESSMKE